MNFLCTTCKRKLCHDCRDIATEYENLLQNNHRALARADNIIHALETELELMRHQSREWEKIAKLGYPRVIQEWMDDRVQETRP